MHTLPALFVVEDHPAMRRLIRAALGRDFQLRFSVDGAQAIEALHAWRPDAVLLDWLLPGPLTGLDVLQIIRSTPALEALPVALVTHLDDGPSILAGFQNGADEYFVKPVHPERLRRWLRLVLPDALGRSFAHDADGPYRRDWEE